MTFSAAKQYRGVMKYREPGLPRRLRSPPPLAGEGQGGGLLQQRLLESLCVPLYYSRSVSWQGGQTFGRFQAARVVSCGRAGTGFPGTPGRVPPPAGATGDRSLSRDRRRIWNGGAVRTTSRDKVSPGNPVPALHRCATRGAVWLACLWWLACAASSPLRHPFGRSEDGRDSGLKSEPKGRRRAN